MTQPINSDGQPFRLITVEQLIKELPSFNHHELHLHCTGSPTIRDHWRRTPDGIYWQKAMRRVHMQAPRKWFDIAQHVTLLPDGMFVTGRSFHRTPASMTGFNGSAPNRIPFMVEMFGWFDPGIDVLQGPQRRAALLLTQWFLNRGKYLRFHNEHANKTCPGRLIVKSAWIAEAQGYTSAQAEQAKGVVWLKGKVINIRTNLNVRSGPGTSFERVGSLANDTPLDILAFQNGWFQVKAGSVSGWVSEAYVQVDGMGAAGGNDADLKKLQDENATLKQQLARANQDKDKLQTSINRYNQYFKLQNDLSEEVK